jgi:putative polyketide hydroxylase
MTQDRTTTVLVVGGGLTGLSSALFLAWHGVDCLLVERHADLLIHPRARGITARTVETYRPLGLEPRIEAASAPKGNSLSMGAETLASPDFTPFGMATPDAFKAISPAAWPTIDQDKLEVVLRDRARELGADIRFSTELAEFEQRPDHVRARIRDLETGTETVVRASHLIAAGGHDSPIRARLGITTSGPGLFAEVVSIMFRADLTEVLDGRPVGVAHLRVPGPGTVIVRTDVDRWSLTFPPGPGETIADYDEARCLTAAKAAIGRDDVDVELLAQLPNGGREPLAFAIGAQVADSYRTGRVFLAGDSAHMLPPTLGLGGSTCIQDAHNLAWKLALTTRGIAGERLLDSYEAERRPVALFTMQALLAVGQARGKGDAPGGGAAPDLSALVFGHRYQSSAVVGVPDGPPDPAALPVDQLAARPGTRAPHVPLRQDGAEVSTVDLFGSGFVLLTEDASWAAAGREVGADLPLRTYLIGTDVTEPAESVAKTYGAGSGGAILVRPDGFIAWRTEQASHDPVAHLRTVLMDVLS